MALIVVGVVGVVSSACGGSPMRASGSIGTGGPTMMTTGTSKASTSVPMSTTTTDSVATSAPTTTGIVVRTEQVLATIPVKGRAPKTGYDRGLFGPAWTDDVDVADGHNGCDTRNDILKRDLTQVVFRPHTHDCVVASGVLVDPYTGRRIDFLRGPRTSVAVQIDHVVALSDAWQKGAQQLDDRQRRDLANDPLNLLAVDGPTNEAKRDGDAATWLPPNKGFRCRYVVLQTWVKARYHLWTTQAEHDAIARILTGCSDAQVGTIG